MNDEPTLADELEVMLGTGPEAVDWADWEGWSRRAITRIAELEAEVERWEERFDVSQQMVWEQSRHIAELEAEKAERDVLADKPYPVTDVGLAYLREMGLTDGGTDE